MAPGWLDGIHGGVGSFHEAVGGISVLRVEGDADTSRAVHHMPTHREGIVETVLDAVRDYVDVGAAVDCFDNHRKLIAAEACQSVARPQLMLHAPGGFLQVHVAHLVAELVVDLLEPIEVDEDEAEDTGRAAGFRDHDAQMFLEREAVWNIGEHVELRAMHEIGVEARSLDGQGRQTGSEREGRIFLRGGIGETVHSSEDNSQRGSRAAGNLLLDDSLRSEFDRAFA